MSGRAYLPETLTPLFYTTAYRVLTPDARLRYCQLHGLYVSEQILFFETALADRVLTALLEASPPVALRAALERFRRDEEAHSVMFRALNRSLDPGRYATADFHFVRVPRLGIRLLRLIARRPACFPLVVWLMLLLEERALHYARDILRAGSSLEPAVVEAHARHVRDEAHHVRCDQAVLDWLWPRASAGVRAVNARLLAWMVGEFFNAPRRAGLRVLDALAAEFPTLVPPLPAMKRELLALGSHPDFHATLYSRRIVPQTFRRFDEAPELGRMSRVLLAYRPAAVGSISEAGR